MQRPQRDHPRRADSSSASTTPPTGAAASSSSSSSYSSSSSRSAASSANGGTCPSSALAPPAASLPPAVGSTPASDRLKSFKFAATPRTLLNPIFVPETPAEKTPSDSLDAVPTFRTRSPIRSPVVSRSSTVGSPDEGPASQSSSPLMLSKSLSSKLGSTSILSNFRFDASNGAGGGPSAAAYEDTSLWASVKVPSLVKKVRPVAKPSFHFPFVTPSPTSAPRSALPPPSKFATSKSIDDDLAQLLDMFPTHPVDVVTDVFEECEWNLASTKRRLVEILDGEEESAEPAKKRRLVKISERDEHADTKTEAAAATKQPPVKHVSAITKQNMKVKASAKKSRHDSDVSDYESYGDDSEAARSDSEDEETRFIRESEMFDFFNKADLKEFLDTLMCSEEQATSVFGLRPFESVEDLRSKLQSQKRKKLGGLMDKYDEIMRGYSGVDSLIRNCEDIGDSMMAVLKSWSSSTKPSTPNSQASDEDSGAIALTNFAPPESSSLDASIDGSSCLTEQPALLNGDLRLKSYQLVGVSWINLLHTKGCGGILADEMGLGKTAQVIAFLCLLKEKGNNGPHLVIVPSSTIENWMREFERWAPVIDVIAYYGSQSERSELRMKLEESPVDVVLTTYNLACSSKEDRAFLKKLRPHSLILDEGHMMKNMNSSRFKHINSISSSFRLLLTGTPLQNNLMQLLSLLTFILPGLFKDAMQTLKVIFSTKPSAGQDPNSSLLSQQRIVRAKKMMTPFVLRRKKCLVLTELPAKERFVEYCQATPSQAALYQSIVADCKKSFLVQKAMVAEETSEQNGRKKGKRAEAARKKAPPKGSDDSSGSAGKVNILMQLRKAANHPLLFRRLFTDAKLKTMAREIMKEEQYMDANYNYIVEDMTVMTDFELHQLAKKFKSIKRYQLTENCWMDSGKIQKLKEILPDMIEKGDRVLIFSQFVVMLDILEAVLQTMGLSYLRLDGQTQVIERQNLIDQFTEDSSIAVFLLSTKAGGLGLNLTVANVVILHDMDFNPHNDAQAEDRAHRVGQTRNVRVVKLVLENSVEEHILRLADAKLSLDKSLQDVETSQDSNGSSSSCSSSGGALASQDAGDGVDGGTAKRKRRGRRNGEDNDDEDEDEDSGGGGGGGGGTAGAEGDEGGGGGNGDRISARNDRRVMELLHDEWFGSGSGGGGRHDAASKSNGS